MPGAASESWRQTADSLSIFQTGRVDIRSEGQLEKGISVSNARGLDVALPHRARCMTAGRSAPLGYQADFSW